jgi:hypothetical protein
MKSIEYRTLTERKGHAFEALVEYFLSSAHKPFRKGSQGKLHRVRNTGDRRDEYALKITRPAVFAYERIDPDCHSELAALLHIRAQYVRTGLTPHLPDLVDYVCRPDVVVTLTGYASHYDLYSWACDCGRALGHRVWRAILFQLTVTLAWIEHIDPRFRHNDLYSKNVLIYSDRCEGYTSYQSPEGTTFYVPNVGYRAVITDFGMSVLPGKFESLHSMTMQMDDFSRGCGYEGDISFDLYRIFREALMLSKTPDGHMGREELIKECNSIWNEDMSSRYQFDFSPGIRPTRPWKDYPSCGSVLHRSPLFRGYLDVQSDIRSRYGDRPFVVLSNEDDTVLQSGIDIGSPPDVDGSVLPEFMFGATKNTDYYLELPSSRMFSRLFALERGSPTESTDGDEASTAGDGQTIRSLENWMERLLYNFDCEPIEKQSRTADLMEAVVGHLAPRGIQNLSLLQLCLFFSEAPLPAASNRMAEFSDLCKELHIAVADAVLLEYSWMKTRMIELGEWPLQGMVAER